MPWSCLSPQLAAVGMAMSRSLMGSVAAMNHQFAQGAPSQISLIARAPASLLLRSPFPATGPKLPLPRFLCSYTSLMLHRIIFLHHVQPIIVNANATATVDVGESVAEQTVVGLPTRLDCGQQLQYGEQCRRLLLVCGTGAEDVFAITLLKPPWPIYPSLPVLWCSPGRSSSGQIRCSSYSSVWKGSSSVSKASVDSGDTQTIEGLWKLYFADASQWWDNRVDKKYPRTPDFRHKVTRDRLWIDGWSTPAWVKERLKLATQGRLQCHAGCGTRDPEDIIQGRRLLKGYNGKANTVSTSARESRQIARGGGGSMHLQSASTMREANAMLRNFLQQGITIDSDMYVEVLKRCLKQKDGIEAKQVHDCIIKSGMDQNTYVGNNLLSAYIRCGRLQDARRVFDGLLQKNVVSWNIMIGGYAQHSHSKDAMGVFHRMLQAGRQPDAITYLSILKGYPSAGALEWVKEVHNHVLGAGFESDLRVGSALVHMYAKCGSIEDARLLFDRMEVRNSITWNAMIGAYAESGCGDEAYRLFLQMKREGFKANAITYMSILNACASTRALEWVKEVHRHAMEAGLVLDVRVGNALVHMYAKSGSIEGARLVFNRMEERDEITWNVMIGAYAECGCGDEAYQLFLQMKLEGFKPDAITYMNILNACASTRALEWVKEVHRHAMEAGFVSDVRVCNAFVHMYAKSGSIEGARLVFNMMDERNLITWNAMIGAYAESGCGDEAYRLFLQMTHEGFQPDAITYVSILNASASEGALEWVKEVHRHALETGFALNVRVCNALVHMYAKSGSIEGARLVFNRMEERDRITWNAMIGAYAESGCGDEAYRLFLQMKREGFTPDAITYMNILNASASEGALEWVKEVHQHAMEAGFVSDVRVCNALVHMYAKSGSIEGARLVFNRMEEHDGITWNAMIGAYAESGCGDEAYQLFLQMKREGFKPDAITYVNILNACASIGALEWVKEVHRHALEAGFTSDVCVGSALVHMYAKSGSIEDARLVFEGMEERDVVTWTAMIGGLAQHGCGHEALEVFRRMIGNGVKADGASFVAVLSACSHAGLVDDGHRLFVAMMDDYGIEPTVVHCSCMVDLLGRAGYLEEAKLFICNMPVEPNGATWGALLGACRMYGNVELGKLAAKEILKFEPMDASTYVVLSNIYAAAGKWEEVSMVRSMMQVRGIRKEPGRSWIEVDDKVHGFVVGDTSHPEAKEIYAELNRLTDRIKAEGYIPDTRLVLENIDEEDKERALCSHSEKLAIAYGLIHIPYGKPIRIYKNLRVCSDCHTATKFISKVTGREIVARDTNRFHHFNDGFCSCGDYW